MIESTSFPAPGDSRPIVDLIGRADSSTAYAMVNREWLRHLDGAAVDGTAVDGTMPPFQIRHGAELSSLPSDSSGLVIHDWERDFLATLVPKVPAAAVRTWDFGPFPRSWVHKISDDFERLWVHSQWIRDKAIEAGVHQERVDVIPHGVDQSVFSSNGETYRFPTERSFRFLFVGAAIQRKGLDIALTAFASEFGPEEDVCLVVKDRPVDVFYGGLDLTTALDALDQHARAGSFLHLRTELTRDDLAALYRSCQVGLFPYRAEGFALPILEAMACGLPSIVPRFGACLDYCDDETSLFAPHRRIRLPLDRDMVYNTLGFRTRVEEVDFCEVSVAGLRETMRRAFDNRGVLEDKASAGRLRTERHSWKETAQHITRAVTRLLSDRTRRLPQHP